MSECTNSDLASIVVDDEALVPAVEVFMRVDLDAELLQHGLVSPFTHCMHGGAHIVQDAHDARRILGSPRKYFTFISDATRTGFVFVFFQTKMPNIALVPSFLLVITRWFS